MSKTDEKINLIVEEEKPNVELKELELGEYFLHFYIIETSGLEFEDEIDIVMKITAFGEVQYTRIIKNQGPGSQTFWGDHIFFQKNFKIRSEMENDNFSIEILNHNSLFKNDIIGQTQGSTLQIYGEENHAILNRWEILTNPKKSFKKPMGFLKYSINFSKSSDPRANLELQSLDKQKDKKTDLVIPPNIQLKQKQIMIKIFRGEKLVAMDGSGKADPYVKFYLSGLEIRSKTIKETLNPVFNQILNIPTIYPTITQNLKLSFKDHDGSFNDNDYIGSKYFKLSDIYKGVYRFPTWNFIYGAHKKTVDKEVQKQMNIYPEIASQFKGALLMSITMEECDEPSFTREDFTKEISVEGDSLVETEFTARFDIEFIQNLKSKSKKHKICLNWGGDNYFTKDVSYNRGVLIVYERVEIKKKFKISEKGENGHNLYHQLPDVILSVYFEDKAISFYRFKCEDYQLTRKSVSSSISISLKADKSVSDLRQDMAGQLRLKVAISNSNDFLSLTPKMWPPINTRPSFEPIRIICYIFQAKNLSSFDSNASADPVVQFYHFGSFVKSSHFPKTLNPTWNERVILESYLVDGTLAPMIINFWDRDVSFLGDVDHDFMGSTVVKLDSSFIVNDKNKMLHIKKPKWYQIGFDNLDKGGKTLLSFSVIRKNLFSELDKTGTMRKISYIPIERSKHHIKINILGLRNLQSTGILPVKRVKVKINTSSVKKISKIQQGAAFTELIAVAKNSGANPTIGSILSLFVDLPINISNMPSLSCQVIDQGLKLFNFQTIIGSFLINLGAYAFISKYTLLEKLKVLEEKEEELLSLHPSSSKHFENLVILRELVNTLEEEVGFNMSYIEKDHKNLWNHKRQSDFKLDITEEERLKEGKGIQLNITQTTQESDGIEIEEEEYKESKMDLNIEDNENYKEEALVLDKIGGGILKTKMEAEDTDTEFRNTLLKKKGDEFIKDGLSKNLFDKFKTAIAKNFTIIHLPRYISDKLNDTILEKDIPDASRYYCLGYKSKVRNTKHYRLHLEKPLEDSIYMGEDVFTTIDMFRGKRHDNTKKGFFNRIFSKKTELHHKTGSFRGNIEVIEDSILQKLIKLDLKEKDRKILELPSSLEEWKYSKTDSEMLKTVDCVIRVYIVDAGFDQSMDFNSENDSYITLKLGDMEIEDKKIIHNENNPRIFKCYEFEHTFPGPSDLTIKFTDHDIIKRDDLIGETTIDLERRFFDRKFRSFKEKPIEKRKLYLPSLSRSCGFMRCWVDMVAKEEISKLKKWDISPRPLTNLELRIVVWEVYDVPHMDFEEVSDLYVDINMTSFELNQRTDTHYRAQNGFGSFNWRNIFKLKIDEYTKPEMFRLDFKIFDKDITPDDFVSNANLDISDIVNDVLMNERRMKYLGESKDGKNKKSREFILNTKLAKITGPKDKLKHPKILLSIDVLTEKEAKLNPAGFGRSDPNQDPYLPGPIGRFKFSLNPFTMLNQLVGPGFRTKMYLCLALTLFIFLLIIFLPTLISSIIANAIIAPIVK